MFLGEVEVIDAVRPDIPTARNQFFDLLPYQKLFLRIVTERRVRRLPQLCPNPSCVEKRRCVGLHLVQERERRRV